MRVLCIGASLTAGWTEDGELCHPYGLRLLQLLREKQTAPAQWRDESDAQILQHHVEIAGIPGEETCDIRIRLYTLLRAAKRKSTPYDFVVLLAGTNDLCRDIRTSVVLDNLAEMREMVLECNQTTQLVQVTIPEIGCAEPGSRESRQVCPIDVERRRINQSLIREVTILHAQDEWRVHLCDVATALPQYPNGCTQLSDAWNRDKVHLSTRGYDLFAELVYQILVQDALSVPSSDSKRRSRVF